LLDALVGEAREAVLERAIRIAYQPGEILFMQDEPCAGLHVVASGLVKVSKVSPGGREQVLRHVASGGSFNEVAVLDGGSNPATATAVETSEVLAVSRDVILAMLEEHPEFAGTMIQALAGRLRHLVELVEDLSFRQVSERVARVLLQAVAPHPGMGAGADLSRRVTQQEIAEMAGTSREVVARALRLIEASGAIEVDRGEIRLLDPRKLSALS
jgi:CRP/FNR family transcriptional regulator